MIGSHIHVSASPTGRPVYAVPSVVWRRGLTLVEMLVSVTITLLVVFAIVQLFDLMGSTVATGRATIEMSGQLRAVAHRLQQDLDNLTCPVRPWIDPDAGLGYFMYREDYAKDTWGLSVDADGNGQPDFEGPDPDSVPDNATDGVTPDNSTIGDWDDILAFTIKSSGEPFIAKNSDGTIQESSVAEVVWWTAIMDQNGNGRLDGRESVVIMRRLFLVRPDLDVGPDIGIHDVSVDATGAANSLVTLTTPERRIYSSFSSFFPRVVDASMLASGVNGPAGNPPHRHRWGDFVVLADACAFDVKAYDPEAIIFIEPTSQLALTPSDVGYDFFDIDDELDRGDPPPPLPRGSFVDLFFLRFVYSPPGNVKKLKEFGLFGDAPLSPIPEGDPAPFVTYDTWSLGYERDGENQDADTDDVPGLIDEGTDGLDTPEHGKFLNGVDDPAERETSPPYPVPLRGIEVKIRMIEFGTQQVRQVSVVGDFVD